MRATLAAAALIVCAAPATAAAQDNTVSEQLRAAVNADGILQHERAFEALASASAATGNRLSGTPGYDASAQYVAARMEDAGYDVDIQEFEYENSVLRTTARRPSRSRVGRRSSPASAAGSSAATSAPRSARTRSRAS